MQLIDEEDDLTCRVSDFLEDSLQALLELAAELGAGDESTQVQRDDPLVLEVLRHVTTNDALRQPFSDGGLADARFANQDRIVLGPA